MSITQHSVSLARLLQEVIHHRLRPVEFDVRELQLSTKPWSHTCSAWFACQSCSLKNC